MSINHKETTQKVKSWLEKSNEITLLPDGAHHNSSYAEGCLEGAELILELCGYSVENFKMLDGRRS